MAKKNKKKTLNILKVSTTGSAASADPIRAARLKELADAGDKEAERELEAMQNTRMVRHNDI